MEKELDSILQILEKASKTDDVKKLHHIEEQLQAFIKIIGSKSSTENLLSSKKEISDRLEKLEGLIVKLDSNKNLNNDLFLEFKQFVENRKFK
tara:strand:- start:262 stop:540 length:279 start_codon:yes stop_codon:yes gene_type:complete